MTETMPRPGWSITIREGTRRLGRLTPNGGASPLREFSLRFTDRAEALDVARQINDQGTYRARVIEY